MQAAILDFLEVERNRTFSAQLNIDGFDFTDSELEMNVRLKASAMPALVFTNSEIIRESGETDWVISLNKTATQMLIPAREYNYDLTDKASNQTIIKGIFQVI